MNKDKIIFGITLFGLGMLGVLSLLTMNIPVPENFPFHSDTLKLLMLSQPMVFLVVAVVVGTSLFETTKLQVPILEGIIFKNRKSQPSNSLSSILSSGIYGGLIAGVLTLIFLTVLMPFIPDELLELNEKFKPTIPMRFLYGGITEEIVMRFGLMTLFVWATTKITSKLPDISYWFAIVLTAFLFGVGHLPMVFVVLGSPSWLVIFYVIFGNFIGGMFFGFLYWKKGLESACIAHMMTHVVFILGDFILS